MIPLDRNIIDFSNFATPEFNFGLTDIYQFPKEIQPSIGTQNYFNPTPVLPKVVAPVVYVAEPIQTVAVVVPKKTISFTVKDQQGATIPGANIEVNGVGTAQTDINGKVTLPNIPVDASIKISFVGFESNLTTASTITSVVILKDGVEMLSEVVIENKYKKPSNSLLWLLAGAAAAFGIYKYSQTGTKVVRAKI